eukprot:8298741-Ditylum_brightwellii.AAC.1
MSFAKDTSVSIQWGSKIGSRVAVLVCHGVCGRTNNRNSWQELDIQEGKNSRLKEVLGSNDGKGTGIRLA